MKKAIVALCVLMLAVISFSCNESSTTPSAPQAPVLSVRETNVSVALNYSRTISITGGNGIYHVKSVTDSSIVSLMFNYYYTQDGVQYGSAYLIPKKLGVTAVTIEDSAKRAEVKITITVSIMATDPTSMKIRAGNGGSINIMGGTMPYYILNAPNPSVATVQLSSNYVYVTAVTAGSTSVTFQDNANPTPHSVTVPIEVTPIPQFTTAGKVSFNSTKGDFSSNGIASQDIAPLPANSEGAGCWIYTYTPSESFIQLVAYRKKTMDLVDVISITFDKVGISPGTLPIDTTYKLNTASVIVVFDGNLRSQTVDMYRLTSGSVDITMLNSQYAKGTFSGNAVMIREHTVFPALTNVLTNGLFDVPVLVDTYNMIDQPSPDKEVMNIVRKMNEIPVKKMMARMKKR